MNICYVLTLLSSSNSDVMINWCDSVRKLLWTPTEKKDRRGAGSNAEIQEVTIFENNKNAVKLHINTFLRKKLGCILSILK